jgi:hypothetical protein
VGKRDKRAALTEDDVAQIKAHLHKVKRQRAWLGILKFSIVQLLTSVI